jgi:NitT/TauT family transport system ATP-binding protein
MIELGHIFKSFGNLKVFDDFSLEYPEQKITAILGPSGCGKTTMLNILAGLVKVEGGTVITTGNVSYLFQEPRLLPWLTIRENIDLVLRDKMAASLINGRIIEYLKMTGLTDYIDYYPAELSGGMRQRVAIARAFAYPAPLLLMDEPFKSLDFKTQFLLRNDFLSILRTQPRTVVMVTHDVKEAVLMGDRIVIFSDKPIQITGKIDIDCPQSQRIDDEKMLQLEKQILTMILNKQNP